MSEEEIIKYLEKVSKEKTIMPLDNYIQSLLELYNKEKENNRENIKAIEEWINGERISPVIQQKYISKDKIKEKIEEYNKMINATYGDITHYGDIRRDNCIEIRNVLQELLEGE